MCEPRGMSVDQEPIETTPAEGGDPRSRTGTWPGPMIPAAGALQRTGLETMEAVRDGVLPPPPIAMLMQMGITGLEEGRVEFTCAVDESVYKPIGVVHGGLVCTMLDTVAGCAVHTTLPAGGGYKSIQLKVNYLRGPRRQRAAHGHGPGDQAGTSRGLRRGRGARRGRPVGGHRLQLAPRLPAARRLTHRGGSGTGTLWACPPGTTWPAPAWPFPRPPR